MSASLARPQRVLATALPFGMMAGIFLLSSIPGTISPDDPSAYQIFVWVPPDVQNVLHVPVFGLLALLWYRAADTWLHRPGTSAVVAFVLTAGYGWLDEWHQVYVPGRFGSLTDFALDALGAALGVAYAWLRARSASEH